MMLCWILISLFVGFLKAQEVIYAQVGGTVTLPREKKDSENVYVNWYRGNNLTLSRNPQRGIQGGKDTKTHANLLPDFSLQISPVQESDFEIWRCVQHILTSTFERTYKLYHVTIPQVPALIAGDSLSLECQIESTPVKHKVTWIPPENTSCYQRNIGGQKIVVNSVSRCHSGVWTCKLEYDSKQTEATTTVSVIDLSSSQDTVYTSSSEVKIPCSLSSNIPWSILNETGLIGGNWSFTPLNDPKSTHSLLSLSVGSVVRWIEIQDTVSPVKAKERELKDHDLSINLPVSENTRGVYTCNLTFRRKTLSRKVQVEVLKVSSSRGSPVYEGQSVNLTCTLGHQLTSEFKMKWNCSSFSNCSNFKLNSFNLFIPEVKLEHRGKYTCELWKKEKMEVYADLFLKTEKAPVDIWLYVAIGSGVVVFLLLLVVIIMCIRRYRQMMMYRRRKTKFCCCKNPQQNQKGFYKT
uniref:CD4-like protein n=1 Tax=Carassius langsdorfii TaxID=138676 RepID=A9CQ46_CARLG|nr:CD4-like protein [Carassius langsdorfii]